MTCSFDGCNLKRHALNLCAGHYKQSYDGKSLTPLRHRNEGKTCSFDDCGRSAKTKGYCPSHYNQHRTGVELKPIGPAPWTAQRIMDEAKPDGDCLLFGLHQVTRYPQVRYNGGNIQAHRLVFQELKGVLPKGAPIHHICSNANCVNPEHLQRASTAENTLEMLARKDYEAEIARLQLRIIELEAQLEERALSG